MDEPINFKDILRTIEAGFGKNLRTTEARFDFTGPYKKKSVMVIRICCLFSLWNFVHDAVFSSFSDLVSFDHF